jgi:hypothetical protein
MHKHWDLFVKPALDCIELSHIIEIGAAEGANTQQLIDYCRQRGARLTSIDPVPSQQVLTMREQHADVFTLVDTISLDALPKLPAYEAILIDGDHNWYTVYNELRTIENTQKLFPLVLFHDVAWPYARRDMYYAPDRIPAEYRHEYAQKGMLPGRSILSEIGGGERPSL